MPLLIKIAPALFLLYLSSAYALVDYTDSNDSHETRFDKRALKSKQGAAPVKQISRRVTPTSNTAKMINFGLRYHSLNIETEDQAGKIESIQFHGSIKTAYNVFLDFEYAHAKAVQNEDLLRPDGREYSNAYSKGNPLVRLGFNWFTIGGGADTATVDLYAGLSLGENDSDVATSRTDKIFGLSTKKRIESFVLGVGVEMILSGHANNFDELDIGNRRNIIFALGWAATPDIRFSLEAKATKIESGNEDSENKAYLQEDISFSSLTPKLYLLLGPSYNLELGASFRTRHARSNEDIVSAKLINEAGSYGNSFFAGLNFSL